MESLKYLTDTLQKRFDELSTIETKQIEPIIQWIAIIYNVDEACKRREYKVASLYLQEHDLKSIQKGFWRDNRKDRVLIELLSLNKWLLEK